MPPVLWAFFLLLGGATAPDLVRGLDPRSDAISRPKKGKPAPIEYRTWTSRPWVAVADDRAGTCDVTFFALTNRRRPARLVAGGVEQSLDTSWSFSRRVPAGEQRRIAMEFRDPIGGAVLSCQEAYVTCFPAGMSWAEVAVREEGRCAPPPRAPGKKGGRPHLVGRAPAFTVMDPGIGGAYVSLRWAIEGDVDEDFYCPEITVEWPEGTRSVRESDCAPWPGDGTEEKAWTFSHGFAPGEWPVKACLSKSGKVLSCETVLVRVLGGDGSGTPFMGEQR